MRFRLLGVIDVSADGVSVRLGGPRQRAVLADLALHAGQAVPTAQLIDDLWGERPPTSAKATVESDISRLRHALSTSGESSASLVTVPGGYQLETVPQNVDVWSPGILPSSADRRRARRRDGGRKAARFGARLVARPGPG